MKPSDPPELQPELFTEFSREPKKPERLPQITRTQKPIFLSTTVEQIILISILLILAGCLIFFLGVLRGKALGVQKKTASERVAVQTEPAPVPHRAAPPAASVQPTPVPAVKAVEKPPLNADIARPYTIQLVTYKKKDLADKEVAGLQKAGFYSFLIPSGSYYQVCVGQYQNKDDAKKDIKILGSKYKYKDSFLRRR